MRELMLELMLELQRPLALWSLALWPLALWPLALPPRPLALPGGTSALCIHGPPFSVAASNLDHAHLAEHPAHRLPRLRVGHLMPQLL